jgi:lipopolysaccharide/colanic/teichoic acid biosynthesis glycosyltransferase
MTPRGSEATTRVEDPQFAEPRVVDLSAVAPWVRRTDPDRRRLRGKSYEAVKRCLDVVFVLLALPVLLPLWILCWLVVKLECPGTPAIYIQARTGRDARRFPMYKFRTMVPNADRLKTTLMRQNKFRWPDFKIEDDPRITRVGRILRKTSLDELPQLVNVIRGEMSLVGPRPTSFGVDTYQEWHKQRLAVSPGITGLWQIAARCSSEFDERVLLDLEYIERRSVLLDLEILARTVTAVVRTKGAY